MKKLIAVLLCALIALAAIPATAESPLENIIEKTPEDQGEKPPVTDPSEDDLITLNIYGETVRLVYDSSPQYSTVEGGLVQASYYAYGIDGVTMYELFIIFPDSAKPGMVITPEYAALTAQESSVVLIISDQQTERYYLSSLMDGGVYPTGSDFSIAIDDVVDSGESVTYSGSVSATLISVDTVTGDAADTLTIDEAPFRFTIGGSADNRHADPIPTEVPKDMYKV